MQIQVNTNKLIAKSRDYINENEYQVHNIDFDFAQEYTNELVKIALFTRADKTYKVIIANNKCDIPPEILREKGTYILGVYAYEVENEELKLRYSPSPIQLFVSSGSYIADEDTQNSEPITPSEMEQYQQALNDGLEDINEVITEADNLDIDVSKSGTTATVTITKKNGTEKSVNISDGQTGPTGATGRGISSITKTSTSGLVDTYTIQYTTGNPTTYNVTNGEKRRYRCSR